jgi:hypothetical protein
MTPPPILIAVAMDQERGYLEAAQGCAGRDQDSDQSVERCSAAREGS